MGVPGNVNPLLLVQAAGAGGYEIERSLRFNSSDSAYLSRTPASAGTQTTWTLSCWFKACRPGSDFRVTPLFSGSSPWGGISIYQDKIRFAAYNGAYIVNLHTTQVLRDPSAWYHLVAVFDSNNGTSGDRARLYLNGSRITSFTSETYPSSGATTTINSTTQQVIGYEVSNNVYSDCYLADIYFIDGQALTPSSFGEFDTNNVWQPKAYTGSYGTQGWHLDFADNSSNTATTLGKDTSGNSNNWTPNNLSVTAGAGNDSLVDSPTNGTQTDTGVGGEVRGNYCTWNPLYKTSSGAVLSNGNLDYTTAGSSGNSAMPGTVAVTSGKWYWEVTPTGLGSGVSIGVAYASEQTTDYPGYPATSWAYKSDGNKVNNASATSYGASYTTNDVIGIALDLDVGTLVFYKNGSSQGTAYSSLSGTFVAKVGDLGSQAVMVANFGQRPFAYSAPSGFKALCTANLPTPTIEDGSTVMDVKLYTGNGSTQTISGLNFSPDLVWTKRRDSTSSHGWFDIVRGATKFLRSNGTDAEDTASDALTSFNSDGFSLGVDTVWGGVNQSGATYAAWTWDAGSSTVTNTAGSITSSVRASASSGFSVVTFTAPSSGSATIGHGLGVEPYMIIIKSRDQTYNWCVYHKSLTSNAYFLNLNTTAAQSNTSNVWNNTTPTSTVFSLGSGYAGAGATVAYVFSPVSGYSSMGSYVGNGSSDGVFVYTGHRIRFLLIKNTTLGGSNWRIIDTARNTYNVANLLLNPNSSNAEQTTTLNTIDLLSNGFKCRGTDGDTNSSGDTFIYYAVAESPFAYARAR